MSTVPDHPDTPPCYGFTSRMHVVPLPRRPSDEAYDPVTLIVGIGWPAWLPVEGASRVYLKPSRRAGSPRYGFTPDPGYTPDPESEEDLP